MIVARYNIIVRTMPDVNATQKLNPARKSHGMSKNIDRLGKTYQNVASAWLAMSNGSVVSRHSQIMPITEISGSEAINAPTAGAFRPMTAINAIMIPERIARIVNAVKTLSRPFFEQQSHAIGLTNRFIFRAVDIL
jgi:hypothetical protein